MARDPRPLPAPLPERFWDRDKMVKIFKSTAVRSPGLPRTRGHLQDRHGTRRPIRRQRPRRTTHLIIADSSSC